MELSQALGIILDDLDDGLAMGDLRDVAVGGLPERHEAMAERLARRLAVERELALL